MTRNAVLFWLLVVPIVLAVCHRALDASPSLFLYDLVLPSAGRFVSAYKNKTIWVTGASSGIGAELVCQLVQAEAGRIVLSARRVDKLEQVAKDCSERAENNDERSSTARTVLSIVPYDAMDVDSTEAVVHKALEGGSIDMVILSAGIYQLKRGLETPQAESRAIMRVNYESAVELFNALVRLDKWKERGHGQVLAVSSVAGHMHIGLASTYVASKHALGAYFHTVQAEESSWLRTSVACPGPIVSDAWNAIGAKTTEVSDSAKMPVHRAVKLMLTGSTGPSFLFFETWIGNADIQLVLWVKAHFPTPLRVINQVVARIRVAIWERDGVDEFDVGALLSGAIRMLRGEL
jgi:short-subunit dehydrogenase